MNTTTTDAKTTDASGPDLAVIIPHYNDPDRLRICLDALMRNDLGSAEILVVDNNSPTPPDQVLADFPTVRWVTEVEKGAGPARNRGVAETSAPVLAFIDADCVAAADWLATARDVAQKADLVGGRVDVHEETPPPRNGTQAFEKVFAFDFRNYVEVQGFSGAGNLVTHRSVFNATGPFRTVVAEDKEWTQRAVALGHRLIYSDALVVSHPSRGDWGQLRNKWRRMTQEAFALAQASSPGGRTRIRWVLRALMMPISVVAHLPKLLLSPKLSGLSERLRGAAILARIRLQRMLWMLRQALGVEL